MLKRKSWKRFNKHCEEAHNRVDGFVNILKPSGPTSHDMVAYVRRLLGIRRVGHAGTLDPLACGVLVIAVGRALD